MSNKKYTDEHINFLREYGPTHTIEETWEAFFDKFEVDVSLSNINNLIQYYKIPHITNKGITGKSKTICTRGETSSTKNYVEYRRTQISGTEELMCLINDVCTLYDMKKYEFYEDALKFFVKGGFPVSNILKSSRRFEHAKQINVDIPLTLEDDINNIAKQNGCISNRVIFQAIVNYGTNKLPSKKPEFNDFITIKTPVKSQTNTIPNKKSVVSNNTTTRDRHWYTEEELNYIKSIALGSTYKEITEKFNKKFKLNLSLIQITKCMTNHHITTGRRNKISTNTKPIPTNKYYIDGMDELNFSTDNKLDVKQDIDNNIPKVPENVVEPKTTKDMESVSVVNPTRGLNTNQTNYENPRKSSNKRYVIPTDLPKIIERVRNITTASRFEICNCAIKYYLSKKWHIDKRLKIAKYYDPYWLNTKFVQPIMITFNMINQLEKVANEFHCKISTVIIQAYLDYSAKIFDDCGIEFNYVFESDVYKSN